MRRVPPSSILAASIGWGALTVLVTTGWVAVLQLALLLPPDDATAVAVGPLLGIAAGAALAERSRAPRASLALDAASLVFLALGLALPLASLRLPEILSAPAAMLVLAGFGFVAGRELRTLADAARAPRAVLIASTLGASAASFGAGFAWSALGVGPTSLLTGAIFVAGIAGIGFGRFARRAARDRSGAAGAYREREARSADPGEPASDGRRSRASASEAAQGAVSAEDAKDAGGSGAWRLRSRLRARVRTAVSALASASTGFVLTGAVVLFERVLEPYVGSSLLSEGALAAVPLAGIAIGLLAVALHAARRARRTGVVFVPRRGAVAALLACAPLALVASLVAYGGLEWIVPGAARALGGVGSAARAATLVLGVAGAMLLPIGVVAGATLALDLERRPAGAEPPFARVLTAVTAGSLVAGDLVPALLGAIGVRTAFLALIAGSAAAALAVALLDFSADDDGTAEPAPPRREPAEPPHPRGETAEPPPSRGESGELPPRRETAELPPRGETPEPPPRGEGAVAEPPPRRGAVAGAARLLGDPRIAAPILASLLVAALAFALSPADLFRRPFEARYGALLAFAEEQRDTILVTDDPEQGRMVRYGDGRPAGSAGADPEDRFDAQIAMLLHPRPLRVLQIGLGAGNAISSVLQHPVESADVIEPSAAIAESASLFGESNQGVLGDERLRIHVADPRAWLAENSGSWDVIRVDLPDLHVTGAAGFYTREILALAKERLAPGGLLSLRLNLVSAPDETLPSILRTVLEVFPRVTIWHGPLRYAWVINASEERREPDAELLRAKLADPDVEAELASLQAGDPATILGFFVMGTEDARAFAGEAPPITIERPRVDAIATLSADSFHGLGSAASDGALARLLDPAATESVPVRLLFEKIQASMARKRPLGPTGPGASGAAPPDETRAPR